MSDAEFGVEFDTETFSRLLHNDPLVAGLIIDGSYWPKGADRVIGDSDISHLEIAVNDDDAEPTVNGRRWLDKLFHGLARNRSIETIVLARTEEDYVSYHQYDTSSPILAPFFEHNCNLKRIDIEEYDMTLGIFNQLGSALSKCNNSQFRYFYLGGCIFEDENAAEFIRSLEGVHIFTDLQLCGNTIVNMERGQLCCAIGYLLTNVMSNIAVLTISDQSRRYVSYHTEKCLDEE